MSLVITDPKPEEEEHETHCKEGEERDTQFSGLGATPSMDADDEIRNGPVVINADGTLSRIKNWGEMNPTERAQTKRMILARNAKRRKALEEEEEKNKKEESQ
eukprot:TRINITY_DN650_c10_g1_i1.p2 TRINITY_DN650_c10_g1~~TRINITY_DN650_c10_g1_i1.p2  ORF type:complete len:117 (+),score=29.23 TRINITY_DN650_c10_g1_i1:45-353(+)